MAVKILNLIWKVVQPLLLNKKVQSLLWDLLIQIITTVRQAPGKDRK